MGISRYWVASSSASFSSSNWSTTSGGPSGASVPDPSSHVYFDENGPGNCLIDIPLNVLGLTISAGYVGKITQQSYSISIGAEDASCAGGHFLGGSASIDIQGNFYLTGTDFTSTSAHLNIANDFICSNGRKFYHNNGTVYSYSSDKTFSPQGAFFNNLVFARNSLSYNYQVVDGTFSVLQDLTLNSGYLREGADGTINALGNVYCNSSFGRLSPDHDAILSFAGPNKQALFCNGGILPHVFISKNIYPNPVKAYGDFDILVNGDFIVFDGTFNTNRHNIHQGGAAATLSKVSPVADFTWADIIHENPKYFQFTDLSIKGPLDWNWTFGTTQFSFVQNPDNHFPDYTTTYPVTLKVSNDFGSDTTTKYITTLSKYTNFYADTTEVNVSPMPKINYLTSSTNSIYSSHDTSSWVLRYRNLTANPYHFCKNTDTGVWLATTTGSDKPLLRSENGFEWHRVYVPLVSGFNKPAFGNGIFLVNDGNNIYRSANGLYWNLSTYFSTQAAIDHPELTGAVSITEIAFGNGVFALLDDVNNISWTTVDGVTFIKGQYCAAQQGNLFFGKGLFVKGGFYSSSNNLIWISSDGSSWDGKFYQSGMTFNAPKSVDAITYGYDSGQGINTYLAQYTSYTDYTGDTTALIYTIGSTDASSWHLINTNTLSLKETAFYKDSSGSSKFIGVGTDHSGNNIFTTVDGSTWNAQNLILPVSNYLYGVWADAPRIDATSTLIEEEFTVQNSDLILGGVTLSYKPITPIALNLLYGTSQELGVDYTSNGTFVSWSGLAIQDHIIVGDVIRVVYVASVVDL